MCPEGGVGGPREKCGRRVDGVLVCTVLVYSVDQHNKGTREIG